MKNVSILVSLVFVLSQTAMAKEKVLDSNCQSIKTACESAGFVKGEWKVGTGLWVDCIRPIIQGTAQPKKAIKPLPTIDAAVVSACKAANPSFASGEHKGSK